MIEITTQRIAEAVCGELRGDGTVTVTGVSTDTRTAGINDLFVALKGESFDANELVDKLGSEVGAVITNRDITLSIPVIRVNDTIEALGRLAQYYAKSVISTKVNVVLSGSVGKTTTKEMTASVLSAAYNVAYTQGNFNNHIGVPKTLLSIEKEHDALVCEMGMNHRGEIAYLARMVDADIAMITNIGHSHIENLGSREGIRDAKAELLGSLKDDGVLVINGDEPLLEDIAFSGRIVRVGLSEGCDFRAEDIQLSDTGLSYTLYAQGGTYAVTLPCTGRHNAVNSLFAIAAGVLCGISMDRVLSGLMNYRSVGNRQNIYYKGSIRVIADCYNAGIESMAAAVTLLDEMGVRGRRIAVLADMLELGEFAVGAHEELGRRVGASLTDLLLTYGGLSVHIHEKAVELGKEAYHFDTREELAEYLKRNLRENDTVLFKGSHSMKLEEVIKLAELNQPVVK